MTHTIGGEIVVDLQDRRPHARSMRVAVAAVAMVALAVMTGCAQSGAARWHAPGDTVTSTSKPGRASSSPTKAAGEFKIVPAADATDVSVLDPVTVTAQDATVQSVTVTSVDGKQVQGGWDTAHTAWHTSDDLAYGKSYTVTASGTDSAGQPLQQTSAFTTIKPKAQVLPYLRASASHLLKERTTYGVGQPIVVWFDRKVPDKAAAEKLLTVTTSPHVDGSWYWISAQEAHYRPAEYWKSGTSITVATKMFGKDLGGGTYGQRDVSASFKIGQSRIAIADATTKHMQVFLDGAMVRDIPVSLGKGGTITGTNGQKISYWTNSGPHVVLGKTPSTFMTSASYGLTDKKNPNFYEETVYLTVRISDSGEFMHMADWNIPAQGHANTSHGCINIGPANAQWVYDNFIPGDVVDVKGTPVKLALTNGLGDWGMSWADWQKGSAL